MARGRKFTQEFKDSTTQLALNSEEPVRKIAKDLEISEKTLYGWLRDYRIKHNLEDSQIKTKKSILLESIEEENKRLHSYLGYLSPVEFEHKMLQFVNKEFEIITQKYRILMKKL